MSYLYCVVCMLALCAVTSVCNAEKNVIKHKLSQSEKLKKAEALKNIQVESKKRDFSGKFIMHYVGSDKLAVKLGEDHDFKFVKKICKGYFEFRDTHIPRRSQVDVESMKKLDNKLKEFYEEEWTKKPTKLSVTPKPLLSFNVTDAYWSKQWHLQSNKTPSMGVYEAWERGYTGKGVVMAIVDDGMDTEHSDLVDNYNASLSHNFVYDMPGGIHVEEDDGHGTKCAGLAAATKNNECVIGVAYEATLASLRVLDEHFTVSASADALTHELDKIDIYSNSWGYPGNGYGFEPLYELEEAALIQGITEGRNGKGAIYLFAAGNDGHRYDDCNAAGHVNSIYTISVNALASDGSQASYSEECTSIMVATYGGDRGNSEDSEDVLIATTARNDTCTDDFLGTSAACPIAAGIVALALQANPDLTWRDVQHLIAETSTYDGVPGEIFQTNGGGKNVSVSHGFGVMNADRMVETAATWNTVPEKISCVGETQSVYKCCAESIEATHDVQNCHIKYVEHVQVHVHYEAIWREYIELHLVSPQGTDSRILRQRRADTYTSPVEWTFMTVFNWGEDPTGNWTIRMDDFITCDNEIHLYTWTLTLHGTVTDPLAGAPETWVVDESLHLTSSPADDGSLGGHCDVDVTCLGGMHCLLNYNVCVYCNISEYRVVNGYCAKDRKTDGYCDVSNICEEDQSWCNVNNYCEACESDFRRYDDNCYQDGKLGGYCDFNLFCTEPDVGCNGLINRCINCSNGFHVIRGYCTEDGTIYGYCDTEITCNAEQSEACSPSNNWCVTCYTDYGQHIIDGFCFDDGTIGGYCSDSVLCNDEGSGCDLELNKCVTCSVEGFHIIDSVCRQDGVLHGYCNKTVVCQDNSGCDPERHICMDCATPGYRVTRDGFCRQDGEMDGYCSANIACRPQQSGCSAESDICVICYSGHHLHDGFCVEGKYSSDGIASDDTGPSGGIIAGSLFGGIASGIAITAPVFGILLKKLLVAKIKPIIQNSNSNHKTCENGHNGFIDSR